uniref:Uncharacterized protein n=1 Tax=Lepeophtheirus salmonis TaxID=72036 RepID=A0A0K2VDB8_LEPSM
MGPQDFKRLVGAIFFNYSGSSRSFLTGPFFLWNVSDFLNGVDGGNGDAQMSGVRKWNFVDPFKCNFLHLYVS